MYPNTFFALEQIIDRQPLTVFSKTPLVEVIGLMHEWGNRCQIVDNSASLGNSSCVLVLENSKLKGIFTERDLVRSIAAEMDTVNVTVEEVMTQNLVTITPNSSQDIFTVLTILRQHRIRHLPVVNEDNHLLGLITAKNLRQKLQPINMMKWRKVKEIMETEVVYASPDDSVRYLAKLMSERQSSYVAIAESEVDADNNSFVRPVGIITERDIVQFQNLNLDLKQPAKNLMSEPLFLIDSEDTLWTVKQQMQQLRVRRLLVGNEREELIGIITQTSLLQVFDPGEMYEVIATLQQQVCQLEIEKNQLLESRQAKLEHVVEERTAALKDTNRRLKLEANLRRESERRFNSILNSLQDIVWSVDAKSFQLFYINPVAEVIYGRQTAEFYENPNLWLEVVHPEDCDRVSSFARKILEIGTNEIEYRIIRPDGEIRWLYDRARLIRDPDGTSIRIDGIATDITQRKQTETALQESQERYTLAIAGSNSGLWDWNLLTNEVFYSPRWKEILGCTDAEFPNTVEDWSTRLHPEDRDRVLAAVQNHLEERIPFNIEYRLQKKDGEYCWVMARGQAIWNEDGLAVRMAGSIDDISERQAALRERKRREEILKDIASGVSVKVGENFLQSLVEYLSKTLQVDYAFISQLIQPGRERVDTLAVYGKGKALDNFTYDLAHAPCGNVIEQGLCVYPEAVQHLFPDLPPLQAMAAESYAGMPVFDAKGQVLGLIAIVDSKPIRDLSLIEEVLKIFATRATAELERQQAEANLRQSEQKFRVIFDQSFQFIGLLEPNGKLLEANQTALDFIGLTPADVVGKTFWDTPWWSKSLKAQQLLKQGIKRAAKGEFVRFEVEHPGTDERLITVDFSLTPIEDETGKVIMLIPEGRNISDRKQAEAALELSNRLLQAISSIQTQFLSDAEPAIIFDGMLDCLLELTESEYGFIGEIFLADDGNPIVEESYMKFRGRPYLKTHAITNIAWNEETRAFYAENAPKGMEFHNLQTLFGATIVTGEPVIANSPSDDPRRGGLPDGHPPLNAFLGVPFYKNERMTGMVGIANRQGGYNEDIVHYLRPFLETCSRIIEAYKSDRQRNQIERKNQEQAALLDVATDAIMVRDLDNKILFWNRGAKKLYGWTKAEVTNRDANELLYRESSANLTKIQQTVKERGEWQGELKQVTKTGREIIVESRWTLVKDDADRPQSYLVVNTDITEQKQLEAQFLRTQRLESLGTLASGIAHDLNNILAPILGFARLLPLKLPHVDQQTKGFFKIMETNAQRGTALVKQILTFSRGLEGEKGIVQVRHLITEIGQIIGETFPKSLELQIKSSKTLWTVNADVNQLHQVLMNLAVNARDAMPDGGKLTIEAENFTADPEYARLHLEASEGDYLAITVTDTGVGIPPEIIDRIFEPFFTTKEIGRGTGLGLSTVIGIVKSHGGFIDVVSRTRGQRGTKVKIFIPASKTATSITEENNELPLGNGELILVVDDESSMLEVTKATLEIYNYQVLTANNGIEAIALYVRHQQAIDLVIMDIMMPGMDGKTAIRTLKQINPKLEIIAVSGLIASQKIMAELDSDVTAFMSKPYGNEELVKTISEVFIDTSPE